MILIDLHKFTRDGLDMGEGAGAPQGNTNAAKDHINVSVASTAEANAYAEKLGIKADFGNIDPKYSSTVLSVTEETMNDFPEVKVNTIASQGRTKKESKLIMGYGGKEGHLLVNERYYNGKTDMDAFMAGNQKEGLYSSGSAKGAADHEMGHALDSAYGLSRNKEISETYTDLIRSGTGDAYTREGQQMEQLSLYGMSNKQEFIAESWAEYKNSPNPRPIAMKVGGIIDTHKKKG